MKRVVSLLIVLLTVGLLCCGCSNKPTALTLSETALTMAVGDSVSLTVTPTPASAKLSPLSWSSSNTNIVTVDNNGLVRAKTPGSATVFVKDENNVQASCNVTVTDKAITAITVNPASTSIYVGKSFTVTPTIQPVDATNTTLTWSSSNPSVAQVNSSGYVTGVEAGTVNITCTASNGIMASCTVTVKALPTEAPPPTEAPKQAESTVVVVFVPHFSENYQYNPGDFVFPESSQRKLTREEIVAKLSTMQGKPVSKSFAQDAINEIYARNGFVFTEGNLSSYYHSTPWYSEDPNFSISSISAIEKYNIDLLVEYR